MPATLTQPLDPMTPPSSSPPDLIVTPTETTSPSDSSGGSEYTPPSPSPARETLSKPGKRWRTWREDTVDIKPALESTPNKKVKTTPRKSPSGGGYTPEEDWALFQQLRPKGQPKWADVARAVGRDPKVITPPLRLLRDLIPCSLPLLLVLPEPLGSAQQETRGGDQGDWWGVGFVAVDTCAS
jgi:hypothetical protein